jgi:6-phospho-beta-glucosidase
VLKTSKKSKNLTLEKRIDMKISIIGAAGVRTPLLIRAILKRRKALNLTKLSLMDIDGEHLELIGSLTRQVEQSSSDAIRITRTTDPIVALTGADYVITTFRVGGIESRVIDERVPLAQGILGQETTGAGGFAMGMRSIPVILGYVKMMQQVCPHAWLINFANPAGMLTEAVIRNTSWRRVVGICDAPASMQRVIAASLGTQPDEVLLDYIGLNHLGWIKGIIYNEHDILPEILQGIKAYGKVPGLPFDPQLILSLGMIPNEYLYYYYYAFEAVENILRAGVSRGEQIVSENQKLFTELKRGAEQGDSAAMLSAYETYLDKRGSTYMATDTGKTHDLAKINPEILASLSGEGYAGVALDLIEALSRKQSKNLILNIPNQGVVKGLDDLDVIEIPAVIEDDLLKPAYVENIPTHCLGLIMQVKQYERWTIEAAIEGSYEKARLALTSHPLVRDYSLAGTILDGYISGHQGYFPVLR